MKLLIYSHFFAPSVGGVETIAMSLARGLTERRTPQGKREFEVIVATNTPGEDFDDRKLPFPVVRRPGIARLWSLLRRVDLVHLAGPALGPLLLARLARKPCVIEHHGYQAICPNGLLVHQPDRSICPGHFQAGRYGECLRCLNTEMPWGSSVSHVLAMFARYRLACGAARNIGISRHVLARHALPRSKVIYYGIEDAPDRKSGVDQSSDAGKISFAYVGRLVPEKGLAVLLKAAEIAKGEDHGFEILLIGDGPERPKLEQMIEQNGLRGVVRCTGFLQGTALTEALSGVQVVVMPSAWEETAGLAAIEHMMRSKLVIASRIGGLGEVVGDAGLTCAPGDAADLAQQMKRVCRNPGLVQEIGTLARERARKLFLRDRMIAEHARLYTEAFGTQNEA